MVSYTNIWYAFLISQKESWNRRNATEEVWEEQAEEDQGKPKERTSEGIVPCIPALYTSEIPHGWPWLTGDRDVFSV